MALSILPAFVLVITPTAAGAGNTDHTVTRPFTVYDGSVQGSAVQAGGTAQLSREPAAGGGFNAVSDAVACAAVGDVTGVGNLVAAQQTFAIGDTLRLILAGAATNGTFNAAAYMGTIPGTT